MASIDVVLLTKNSERALEKCLNSLYANVPVNQLIVIDGYSTDHTMEILQNFNQKHHNVKVILDKGNRATAREKGIGQVSTDWFMFLDSDVVLCRDWYNKATLHIDEATGAVWGIEVWSTIQKPAMLKMFLRVTRKIFDLRGGTHDTLVRTELVKDIRIPRNLHIFEDAYIKDWVNRKGYQVVACFNPYCIHYRPEEVWTLRGSLNLIADAIRFGSVKLLGKLVLAYGFYSAYSVYQVFTKATSSNS